MNNLACSAIFLDGKSIASSDELPYRSRHSLANWKLVGGFQCRYLLDLLVDFESKSVPASSEST